MVAAADPEHLLKKYHIDYCLLANGAPELQVLPHLPDWRNVYQDKIATIFVRTAGRQRDRLPGLAP